MLDLAIIGGGPAALSAAIYAARASLNVSVLEKRNFGGILPEISHLENYPGYSGPGQNLATSMREQAEQSGAHLVYGECTQLQTSAQGFNLTIDESSITARTVLVTTGSEPRRLPFDLNIPVSYCALCDGALTKGKNVVVVGGANSAAQEALYLASLAAKVTMVTHSALKANQALQDRLGNLQNLEIIEHLEPTPEYLNQFDYCFVYIGKKPATEFLPATILDQNGYVNCVNTGDFPHQSPTPGLFAAGDVRRGSIKQVITAAGDGAAAAIEITTWLSQKS